MPKRDPRTARPAFAVRTVTFCKREETLREAVARLRTLSPAAG
ncbi:hypothetical protein [Streptomyces jumonjinensis]